MMLAAILVAAISVASADDFELPEPVIIEVDTPGQMITIDAPSEVSWLKCDNIIFYKIILLRQ